MKTRGPLFQTLLVVTCLAVMQGALSLPVEDDTMSLDETWSRDNFTTASNDTQDYENEYEINEPNEQLENNTTIDGRIFFSLVAADTTYPYTVALTVTSGSGGRTCTGTLLTNEYVITSANCVYDATAITGFAGTLDPTAGTAIASGTAIVHPKYYSDQQDYNIALVKLGTPLTLSTTINTINIASKGLSDDYKDLEEKNVIVIGFGMQTTTSTNMLSYANMKVLSRWRCVRDLKNRNIQMSYHQNCIDTESGTLGLCSQIDIGGPVIHKFDNNNAYTLVGVTNYRYACATSTPNLFTRVNQFYDWIRIYVPTYNNQG